MPKPAVKTAAALMGVACVVGAYLGISRSLTTSGFQAEEAGAVVPAVIPVSSAHPIAGPVLDEAEVRRMAREEAQTIVAKTAPAPKKAAAKDDDDDDSASEKTQATVPLVPLSPGAAAKPLTNAPG